MNHKLEVFFLAVAACFLVGWLLGHPESFVRIFIFDFTLPFAAAFYLLILISGDVGVFEANLLALVFESTVLALSVRYFLHIRRLVASMQSDRVDSRLAMFLMFQFALFLPLLLLDGFGLFSDGDRNQYISNYWFAKYLIYAIFIISAAQIPLVAAKFKPIGRFGWLAAGTIGLNFVVTLFTGSKGVVFLWIISILSLVDFDWRRCWRRILAVFCGVSLTGATASILAVNYLELSFEPIFELLVARFFLSNDARALVYEFSSSVTGIDILLRESFRSVSPFFGVLPDSVPLGVQLYRDNFGFDLDVGANASLLALVMYFGGSDLQVFYILFCCLAVVLFVAGTDFFVFRIREPVDRCVAIAVVLLFLRLISQDFFAVQILLVLVIACCLLVGCLNVLTRIIVGKGSRVDRSEMLGMSIFRW